MVSVRSEWSDIGVYCNFIDESWLDGGKGCTVRDIVVASERGTLCIAGYGDVVVSRVSAAVGIRIGSLIECLAYIFFMPARGIHLL